MTTIAAAGPSTATDSHAPPTWRSFFNELRRQAVYSLFTAVALSLSFPPVECWPLAFIALVPWVYGLCTARRPWVAHWSSYIVGGVYFAANLFWLYTVTDLGFIALAFYLAIYWPMAGWVVRTGQRWRISPLWTLPISWIACEFIRAWALSGFPWLLIGHAFFRHPLLIQTADIGGAYLVGFLALLLNGLIADLLLHRAGARPVTPVAKHPWRRIAIVAVVVFAALGYGQYRISTATLIDGPRIAVVQEDFPLSNSEPGELSHVVFARYAALAARAAQERPDLIVFPETAWNAEQNVDYIERRNQPSESARSGWAFSVACHEAIAALARGDYRIANERIAAWEQRIREWARDQTRPVTTTLPRLTPVTGPPVTVVVGAVSVELFEQQVYPREKRYNSALVYDPDGAQRRTRYDKIHLVPFGELVPFRYGALHSVYLWLNSLSPFSHGGKLEYSLTPGDESRALGDAMTVFPLKVGGRTWRFGTPICYEDVMPYISRHYVWDGDQRRVDFLVNISNDGWFMHSAELPQHLASCVFRAVENRVGIARAVNTGISGFIDPNGQLHDIVADEQGREYRSGASGVVGYRIANVRVDETRGSVYGQYGDWFAWICLVLSSLLWLDAVRERWGAAAVRRIRGWFRRAPAGP